MRTNAEWLRDLRASGPEQAAAIQDLRAYLRRAARYTLARRAGGSAGRGRADVDQLAEDCAQDALLAILLRLDDFRGDSRFTTWAYAFAVHGALVAARREAWKAVPLDPLLAAGGALAEAGVPEPPGLDPEGKARRAEAWMAIRDVLDHELTDRQRQALSALVFQEVPLDELARHWGSTRNALYKLVHDARKRLKARLEARGFPAAELLQLFSGQG